MLVVSASQIRREASPIPPPLEAVEGLEEVCADQASAVSSALGFVFSRPLGDVEPGAEAGKGWAFVAPRAFWRERGRVLAAGLPPRRSGRRALVIVTRTEAEALWALEEVLRSGVFALAVGAVEGASLLATRRLDMAAKAAGGAVVLLKTLPDRDLSAARRRWRISPRPSAPHPWDPRASGAARWRVELTRRRNGPLGAWDMEADDATGGLGLVAGLADHGLELGEASAGPRRLSA